MPNSFQMTTRTWFRKLNAQLSALQDWLHPQEDCEHVYTVTARDAGCPRGLRAQNTGVGPASCHGTDVPSDIRKTGPWLLPASFKSCCEPLTDSKTISGSSQGQTVFITLRHFSPSPAPLVQYTKVVKLGQAVTPNCTSYSLASTCSEKENNATVTSIFDDFDKEVKLTAFITSPPLRTPPFSTLCDEMGHACGPLLQTEVYCLSGRKHHFLILSPFGSQALLGEP